MNFLVNRLKSNTRNVQMKSYPYPLAQATSISVLFCFIFSPFCISLAGMLLLEPVSLLSYSQEVLRCRDCQPTTQRNIQASCLVRVCIHIQRDNRGVLVKTMIKTSLGLFPQLWETLRHGIKSLADEGRTLPITSTEQDGGQVLFVLLWNPSLQHRPQPLARASCWSQKSNSDHSLKNRKELVPRLAAPVRKKRSTPPPSNSLEHSLPLP